MRFRLDTQPYVDRNIRDRVTHVVSDNGETALGRAVLADKIHTAEVLLSNGANVNESSTARSTPLMLAAGLGRTDMVDLLLSRGADVYAVDENNETALVHALVGKAPVEVVSVLISAGSDVNAKDFHGRTALQLASMHGQDAVVAILKQAGAREYP